MWQPVLPNIDTGCFFRPVAVSFHRPGLHFFAKLFFCKPCILCTKHTHNHTLSGECLRHIVIWKCLNTACFSSIWRQKETQSSSLNLTGYFWLGISSHEKHQVFSPQFKKIKTHITTCYAVGSLLLSLVTFDSFPLLPFSKMAALLFQCSMAVIVCEIRCLWRSSHSSVLWIRRPPTLTSVPCKGRKRSLFHNNWVGRLTRHK